MPSTPWPSSAWSRRRPPRPSGRRAATPPSTSPASTRSRRETKHDVIAFLTHLAEIVGPDARFVHQGMTSSDVLDTCFDVQLMRAADLLLADIDALLAALQRRAFEHKDTVTIGRSHGIHAEPTTFGVKLAKLLCRVRPRPRAASSAAREEVATCAVSGAVGTFANIDPRVEEHVAARHGPEARAGLHPGHPARPPRHVFRHARRRRLLDRAAGDRDPPSAAHRGAARRRNISRPARRAPRRCRTSATRC